MNYTYKECSFRVVLFKISQLIEQFWGQIWIRRVKILRKCIVWFLGKKIVGLCYYYSFVPFAGTPTKKLKKNNYRIQVFQQVQRHKIGEGICIYSFIHFAGTPTAHDCISFHHCTIRRAHLHVIVDLCLCTPQK